MRLIASPCDDSIIVSLVDSTLLDWWQINRDSEICVQETELLLHVKGLRWSIEQLFEGGTCTDRFCGGFLVHRSLDSCDYYLWHVPVGGKIVKARLIQAQACLDVLAEGGAEKDVKVIWASDGTGQQFVQRRGLIVIDSPIDLVAACRWGWCRCRRSSPLSSRASRCTRVRNSAVSSSAAPTS